MDKLYKYKDVVQMLADVIEQIEENEGIEIVDRPMGWESIRDYAEEVVSDIPSVENKGEWIIDNEQKTCTCSECNIVWDLSDEDGSSNFCSYCGAMMKGADGEL